MGPLDTLAPRPALAAGAGSSGQHLLLPLYLRVVPYLLQVVLGLQVVLEVALGVYGQELVGLLRRDETLAVQLEHLVVLLYI